MSRLRQLARNHQRMAAKTLSYYGTHMLVAIAVAYAVTGDWLTALTLSLIEPTVQAVAYVVHEKAWARVPGAFSPTNPVSQDEPAVA